MRSPVHPLILFAGSLAVAPAVTVGQQPPTPPMPATVPAAPPSSAAATPTADPAPAPDNAAAQDPAKQQAAEAARKKAEAEQKKQQRLQKIKQVKFDRRATTMLRTWSSPTADGVVAAETPAAPTEAPPDGVAPDVAEEAMMAPTVTMVLLPTPMPLAAPPAPVAPADEPAPSGAADAGAPDAGAPAAATPTPADQAAKKPKVDPFDQALKDWARAVTLGDWAQVKTFLASLENDAEKKAAWQQMVQGLRNPPPPQGPQPPVPGPQFWFGFDDVLGLCAADPLPRDDATFNDLGAILQMALGRGLLLPSMLERLRAVTAAPAEQPLLSRREAAKLLFAARLEVDGGEFLPTTAEAAAARDFEALNLLARHFVAKNQKEGTAALLEQAWDALQQLFAAKDVDPRQKAMALQSAVALAPRLQQQLGRTWLDQSFTREVQRGMDILASIGVAAADAGRTQPQNAPFRQQLLALQKTAVDALLAASPERADQWSLQLGILADNWLREAQTSYRFDQSTSYGPRMRRDRYGNFFYFDEDGMQQGNRPAAALSATDVLELRPSDAWLQRLEPGMRPKLAVVTAQLWLKVQEEQQAFPFIKALAQTHPQEAKQLVEEFLRVWTRNHDPNEGRHNYYFYGYESRAEGIPLTRSKQERNLKDLAHWMQELRRLPIEPPDQDLLAKAFTTCHSNAEVYRLEAIEQVFGGMELLEPRTLAALLEQMRTNLGTVWRQPNVQEKAKTRRKQQDIEAEVKRGYELAHAVVDDGLKKHAGDWSLLLARATLQHDENDYRREIGNEVKYTERRLAAFADFAAAAAAYQLALPKLPRERESVDVYSHWFYAALGASDLQNIKSEHVTVDSEVAAVRTALQALPGDAAERHMSSFANSLFTRMGALNPAVKMRYVQAGLQIVGDHKQAFEAKKLCDYYQDIVGEIRLETRVDGATTVASGQPFGVFVELRHTPEIERESGGFGRYLRNQNDVSYSFNYGRPTENYRDKFADMVRERLGEQFDVKSITFQNDTVHSRATEQYGWRVTPYAYLLLQPRGPQVDRVPSLRLDLDFLDTSGYAVLPIESPALPIDAGNATAPARPCRDVEVTQILDERQARDGKLLLEVKATAHGLLPGLDDLLDLAPAGFDRAAVDDSGPQVSRFDPDAATDAVTTERTWNVTLRSKPDLPSPPRRFRFATARAESTRLVRQRYADADLVAAEAEIELDAEYGRPRTPWLLYGAIAAGLALCFAIAFLLRRRSRDLAPTGLQLPEQITPFTVLGLMRAIRQAGDLDAAQQAELDTAIQRIESGFFARTGGDAPDLQAIAREWVDRANRATAG